MSEKAYVGPERRKSGATGTGVQYLPGHIEEFVDYVIENCLPDDGKVLDLGGGGLRLAIPVARKNKEVTVVDLDAESLDVAAIVKRVNENGKMNLDPEEMQRLIHTEAADVIDFLEKNSEQFDLITAFRLIVYFPPEGITKLFSLMKDALAPGGKLAVSGLSPYNHNNPDDMNEIFAGTSAAGDERLYRQFAPSEEAQNVRAGQNLPERLHFSDAEWIARQAEQAGLKVLESDLASTRVVNGYILGKD